MDHFRVFGPGSSTGGVAPLVSGVALAETWGRITRYAAERDEMWYWVELCWDHDISPRSLYQQGIVLADDEVCPARLAWASRLFFRIEAREDSVKVHLATFLPEVAVSRIAGFLGYKTLGLPADGVPSPCSSPRSSRGSDGS